MNENALQLFSLRLSPDAQMCPLCCDNVGEGELNSGCDIVKLFLSEEGVKAEPPRRKKLFF